MNAKNHFSRIKTNLEILRRIGVRVEKPTHVDPVRRFRLTLDTIFILPHFAKI